MWVGGRLDGQGFPGGDLVGFLRITALMRCRRSSRRLMLEEYALSAMTASGRVRGRPRPDAVPRISSSTCSSMAPSFRCPPVMTTASGRPCPSTAWWILVVNPPRDLPMP